MAPKYQQYTRATSLSKHPVELLRHFAYSSWRSSWTALEGGAENSLERPPILDRLADFRLRNLTSARRARYSDQMDVESVKSFWGGSTVLRDLRWVKLLLGEMSLVGVVGSERWPEFLLDSQVKLLLRRRLRGVGGAEWSSFHLVVSFEGMILLWLTGEALWYLSGGTSSLLKYITWIGYHWSQCKANTWHYVYSQNNKM